MSISRDFHLICENKLLFFKKLMLFLKLYESLIANIYHAWINFALYIVSIYSIDSLNLNYNSGVSSMFIWNLLLFLNNYG